MADGQSSGLSPSDVNALIAFAIAGLPTAYVGGTDVAPTTVASLLSTYPPSVTYLGKYARVTDLYGTVDDIMRCRFDGTNYRWVPQRTEMAGNNTTTTGTVTVTPLVTPPTLRLTGNLLGNITITPASTNAYLGQRFRVIMVGTLGLFTSTITGLIGSNLTLLGNGTHDIEFGSTGWFQST